jgi:hypothetical protein
MSFSDRALLTRARTGLLACLICVSVTGPRHLLIGASIEGTVLEADTGLPVSGATVSASSGTQKHTVTTDASGRYVFDDLPAGEHVVVAQTSNSSYESRVVSLGAYQEIRVVHFLLPPAYGSITGRVTGANGRVSPVLLCGWLGLNTPRDNRAGFSGAVR